jgi:hypothetical protein
MNKLIKEVNYFGMPCMSSFFESCDSLVSIATGYGLDGRGSIPGRSKSFSSALMYPDLFREPPSLPQNGCQGDFPWAVKWPGHNADHSPSSTAEVKMVELYLHSPT